ncbi:MAG TPA: ParB/RepB/Spo0J family partition protein [Nitrososphaeraceae archaeon]|nr:ParB/RepB/Spo0J family partition protein [Nitrososphaeraceae archaeon]
MKLIYSSDIPGMLENVSISQIKLPEFYYREKELDEEIENLKFSMKQYGLLNPIIVRNIGNYFEVVTGVRRYKASKLLGWRKILCHVIDVPDKEAYEISLMSNLQHKQLGPIEEALAFKKYLYNYKWGQITELAYKIGKSHSYIHRRLKLLECSQEIIDALTQRRIEPSIAEEIVSIKHQDVKTNLITLALENKITCQQIRKIKDALNTTEIINPLYMFKQDDFEANQNIRELDEKNQKLFNKMIILLKNTLRTMSPIIEDAEDDWIVHNIFMQHKNMIDKQIDILIKEKKKIN